jgi:hypothetical protein
VDASCLGLTCGAYAGWSVSSTTVTINSLGTCLDASGCLFNCTLINP